MPEKSAEEWSLTIAYASIEDAEIMVKQIQRNAKHAAMLEAAEMVIKTGWRYEKLHARILEAAKKYED